jgi:hypothetical protein
MGSENKNHESGGLTPSFRVGGHGYSDGSGLVDQRTGANKAISAKDLAAELKKDPKYDPSKPVRLSGCYAGKGNYAQELANELGNTVIAPKTILAVNAWPLDGNNVTKILYELTWWGKFTPNNN